MERMEIPKELAKVFEKILEEIQYDDEWREKINQMFKQYNIDYYIPEPKEKKRVEEKISKKIEQFDEKAKELEVKLQTIENEKKLQKAYEIMDRYGIPREKLSEVEQLAKEAGITKWETACAFYAQKQAELKNIVAGKPIMEREKSLMERYAGVEGRKNLKEDLLELYKAVAK